MKTDSGSTRIRRPKWNWPAVSQSQSVEAWTRSSWSRLQSEKNVTQAATKEIPTDGGARSPGARRERLGPGAVIAPAAKSGESRQIQAAPVTRAGSRAC